MTRPATGEASLAATYDRVAAHLVGRERELTLVLAAVAAGRDIVLEGPPGTSKSTLLRAITAEWGIPLVFVEGNADLTPAKLVGHHNLGYSFANRQSVNSLVLAAAPITISLVLGAAGLLPLIGCNGVTRHDARISVRAGFTEEELSALWPAGDGWRLKERRAGLFSHCFVAQRTSGGKF